MDVHDEMIAANRGDQPTYKELEALLSASQAREAELREELKQLAAWSEDSTNELQKKLEAAADELAEQRKAAFYVAKHMHEYKQRAEAAEAKIKASQEQEPDGVYYHKLRPSDDYFDPAEKLVNRRELETKLFAERPIPPDLAELQRENAELKESLRTTAEKSAERMVENTELRKLLESKDSPETDIDQATRLNG